jgi:hypothetical protein
MNLGQQQFSGCAPLTGAGGDVSYPTLDTHYPLVTPLMQSHSEFRQATPAVLMIIFRPRGHLISEFYESIDIFAC